MAYLTERARPGAVFLDVGANAGLFALAFARACPQAQVYAFEPAARTFDLLRRNITLNGLDNIRPERFALSDRTGEALLSANTSDCDGFSSLMSWHPYARPVGTEAVPTMTLDAFLEREGVGRVDIVKVDVEGAEALVLLGASRLLSASPAPTILFECWQDGDLGAVTLLDEYGYAVSDFALDMKIAVRPAPGGSPEGDAAP